MSEKPRTPPEQGEETKQRAPWAPMTVKPMGSITKLVQGGGGKLSVTSVDAGDIRKPMGHGG